MGSRTKIVYKKIIIIIHRYKCPVTHSHTASKLINYFYLLNTNHNNFTDLKLEEVKLSLFDKKSWE